MHSNDWKCVCLDSIGDRMWCRNYTIEITVYFQNIENSRLGSVLCWSSLHVSERIHSSKEKRGQQHPGQTKTRWSSYQHLHTLIHRQYTLQYTFCFIRSLSHPLIFWRFHKGPGCKISARSSKWMLQKFVFLRATALGPSLENFRDSVHTRDNKTEIICYSILFFIQTLTVIQIHFGTSLIFLLIKDNFAGFHIIAAQHSM